MKCLVTLLLFFASFTVSPRFVSPLVTVEMVNVKSSGGIKCAADAI